MAADPRPDEQLQLRHLKEDLRREFSDLPPGYVDTEVSTVARGFENARVRAFIPVLVGRGARARLRGRAGPRRV